jgi:branched-chain amino acid aminotransferase
MRTKGADFMWFDGNIVKWEEATVPVTTHALHYGTAVFEGIRAYSSKNNLHVFRLREHMDRLRHSAAVYSIAMNYSAKELEDATIELLKKNRIKESCYIRPLAFVGQHGIDLNVTRDSPTHVVIIVFPFAKYFKVEGISACISSWRRIHDSSTPPMAKAAGNYLNSVLATQESNRNGYDESVMLDRDGNVSEASGENIFIVRNSKIYTPYIAGSALEGITRDTAIAIAKNLGYELMERPISRTELYMASELFLTGTAAEIVAIIDIDGRVVGDGNEGPVTSRIRTTYSKIVTAELAEYTRWLTSVW